jgi:hypothetical protein
MYEATVVRNAFARAYDEQPTLGFYHHDRLRFSSF